MGISLEEALNIHPLNKAKVIAGSKGLDRIITQIGVTDVPDFADWIRGNELILTTGYFIDPTTDLQEMIRTANDRGAAGIGIKFKRYINELDQETIELANELAFPILSLPYEHRWVDYFNTVFSTIVNKDSAEIGYAKKMLEDFTQIVLEGGGFDSIVRTAGIVLDRPCGLFDNKGNLIAYFGFDKDFWYKVNKDYCNNNQYNSLSDGIYYDKIKVADVEFFQTINNIKTGNEHFGTFFVLSQQIFSNYDYIILQQMLTVSCLEFQKKKAVETVERNYRDIFLNDLILGLVQDKNVIESKLKFYGLKLNKGGTIVLVEIYNNKIKVDLTNKRASDLRNIFDNYLGFNNMFTYLADQIAIIIPSEKNVIRITNDICNVLKTVIHNGEFKIAIGRNVLDIAKISDSYKDARNIMKIAHISEDTILDYKNLGLLGLLLDKVDKQNLIIFFEEYLKPIIDYEKDHNTNLIDTLSVYYQENCNIRKTGSRMFIHFNTVKYRLNIVRDLLKMDIDNPDVKTTLTIALKIKTILE